MSKFTKHELLHKTNKNDNDNIQMCNGDVWMFKCDSNVSYNGNAMTSYKIQMLVCK